MSQFKDHQTFTLPGTSPATQGPQSQAKPSDSDARRNTMIPTISSTQGPLSRPGRGMSLKEAGESPCPLPINEPLLMAKPNLSLTPLSSPNSHPLNHHHTPPSKQSLSPIFSQPQGKKAFYLPPSHCPLDPQSKQAVCAVVRLPASPSDVPRPPLIHGHPPRSPLSASSCSFLAWWEGAEEKPQQQQHTPSD